MHCCISTPTTDSNTSTGMILGLASISCWLRSDRGKGCAISRRGDHDSFKFHNISASIWLFSRDTVPKQVTLSRLTMVAHYSFTVSVSVGTVPSVSTPCAATWMTAPLHQQRISGPTSETANAGSVGNQAQSAFQTPHSCVRRPIRLLSETADYTTGPVCCLRRYTRRSHTPTACMHNGLNYQGLPAVPLCISRPLIRC